MASKRRQRRKMCLGKARHETFENALKAMHASARVFGVELRPYKCEHCPFWHIGHNPRQMRGKFHVWRSSRPK